MTVGDLFSGIGGFSYGLELAGGFETKWFVENDDYCNKVLAKHWPNVKRYGDIRNVHGKGAHQITTNSQSNGLESGRVAQQESTGQFDGNYKIPRNEIKICPNCLEPVDLICGGFPCQDISCAGKGIGLNGDKSGLWFEFKRIIGELRPKYALMENVGALTFRGLQRILGDLAELRYDAEWLSICASDIGAPHRRERIWIIAYPNRFGCNGTSFGFNTIRFIERISPKAFRIPVIPQSPILRVDDGVSNRVHRLKCLGNAVVPQVVEIIGRMIMEVEAKS